MVENYQTSHVAASRRIRRGRQIGDRPSGGIAESHPLTQAASRALADVGLWRRGRDVRISSTDANIPLSRGIPAVCVGITEGGNAHRLEEWISTEPLGPWACAISCCLTWWAAAWLGGEIG